MLDYGPLFLYRIAPERQPAGTIFFVHRQPTGASRIDPLPGMRPFAALPGTSFRSLPVALFFSPFVPALHQASTRPGYGPLFDRVFTTGFIAFLLEPSQFRRPRLTGHVTHLGPQEDCT